MDEQIRTVTIADIDGVAKLLAELSEEDGQTSADVVQVSALIRSYVGSQERTIYVAVRDDVIGYIAVHWIPFPMLGGTEAYVSDLVIRTTERGTGIGSRLLSAVEDRARARGCVRLMLNHRGTSKPYLRGFYSKRGFRQRDEFANLVKALR